jgi:predicted acetyltransferase
VTIEYGPPRDDDELRAYLAIGFQSLVGTLLPNEPGWLDTWKARTLPYSRARVARREGAVAAGLVDLDFGQFFGGRSVPMAGVSFVATAPEHRDRKVARAMMRAYVRELYDRGGPPISALYPATQPLYRGAGFETAGWFVKQRLATSAIRERAGTSKVRRAEPRDHESIRAIYNTRAKASNGMLDRSPWSWARIFDPTRGGPAHAYVAEGEAGIEGYVSFTQRPLDGPIGYVLDVLDLQASTERGHRAMLALLGGHRTMAPYAVLRAAPNDPFFALLDEQPATAVDQRIDWMVRIVDVPRAMAARGWTRGARVELDFAVVDDLVTENEGRWRVEISGGQARATRGGNGAIRLDVRTLASLYSGYHSPRDLFRIGKLHADDSSLDAMTEAFAGSAPWMCEMF